MNELSLICLGDKAFLEPRRALSVHGVVDHIINDAIKRP